MCTKGYGFTVDDIDWSCPADLEPYSKAHILESKEIDSYVHKAVGIYLTSALGVTLESAISKNPKSKYIKEPILELAGMTEEEIRQKALEEYKESVNRRKREWDLRHKQEGE